jgi:hypothetical protein
MKKTFDDQANQNKHLITHSVVMLESFNMGHLNINMAIWL